MENRDYYYINNPAAVGNKPVEVAYAQAQTESGVLRGRGSGEVGVVRESRLVVLLRRFSYLLGVAGVLVVLVWFVPGALYALGGGEGVAEVFARPFVNFGSLGRDSGGNVVEEHRTYQPAYDAQLPIEDRVMIPSIGVDSQIKEASVGNYEDALRDGVWRVTDFGTPFSRNRPTILVAHRYGYLKWTNIFRKKSSFYNLPKVKEGDIVEVNWGQRKYVYEMYSSGEGEEITDYTADLILYTCEDLNSPVRVFKYGRLLEV